MHLSRSERRYHQSWAPDVDFNVDIDLESLEELMPAVFTDLLPDPWFLSVDKVAEAEDVGTQLSGFAKSQLNIILYVSYDFLCQPLNGLSVVAVDGNATRYVLHSGDRADLHINAYFVSGDERLYFTASLQQLYSD